MISVKPSRFSETLSRMDPSSFDLFEGRNVPEGIVEGRTVRVGPRAAGKRAFHRRSNRALNRSNKNSKGLDNQSKYIIKQTRVDNRIYKIENNLIGP